MANQYAYDWSDVAFASKKPLRELKATFIVAPRELSVARLTSLVKEYLSSGHVVLGISKEPFVDGFSDQPQFRMLEAGPAEVLSEKIAKAKIPHKLFLLSYHQRELPYILEKVLFRQVVLVNGSWRQSFHTTPAYYALAKNGQQPVFVSPFVSEDEAIKTATSLTTQISNRLKLPSEQTKPNTYTEQQLMTLADQSAQQSFDHTFQTGAVLAKKSGSTYRLLATAYNQIVPYETFAMHHGASREQFQSPPNDLNHYDTVHAEVQGILAAQRNGVNLAGTAMFVNLLPCPVCSRILVLSGISEVVYQHDHSDAYAVRLLQKAGLEVRRLVV